MEVIRDMDICEICLHTKYCQHNYDYECQEVQNYFDNKKLEGSK